MTTGIEDPDRFRAKPDAHRETWFKGLRARLIGFVSWKRSASPEDDAQEAVVRGLRRIREGAEITAADEGSYYVGIASNVVKEGWKPRKDELLESEAWQSIPSADRTFERINARQTLERCLSCLSKKERTLLIRYLLGDRKDREALADSLGITLENLRVKVHRLRGKVERATVILREGTEREAE